MTEPNWYAILGIQSKASAAEIKSAFRKLAHQYHPDKTQNPVYTEQFKQIKKAYEILGNPSSKFQYDKSVSLQKNHASAAPSLLHISEIMHYFFAFEKEMKQADIRFINYDRIKWKFNYAFGMPHVLPSMQSASKEDQDYLLVRQLYCLSFLPYEESAPFLKILREYFVHPEHFQKIQDIVNKQVWEARCNQWQVPMVALVSILICLGIYWLVK